LQRLPEIQQLVRSLSVENDALREVRYLIRTRCPSLVDLEEAQ